MCPVLNIQVWARLYKFILRGVLMKFKSLAACCAATFSIVPVISYGDASLDASRLTNPAINFVLEGRYGSYDGEGHFEVPGFQLVSEEGLYAKGFSTGHNEMNVFANLSESAYGVFSAAIESHDGATEVGIEEAFIESSALGNGVALKAGQFFSHIGIYNQIHEHGQDFADVPLVYAAMFNTHLVDTGLQLRWKMKSAVDLELGLEATTGTGFPGGEATTSDNNKGRAAFVKLGQVSENHTSWKAGLSFYSSDFNHRAGGHHEDEGGLEIHDGTTDVTGFDVAFTMSPNGHKGAGEFKLQLEYFQRDEEGEVEYAQVDALGNIDEAESEYDGDQTGLYLQATYGLTSKWRMGFRYDLLEADNTLANFDGDVDLANLVLTEEDTGLIADEDPTRIALMVDYSPNPLSTIRLQLMKDESGHEDDHENRIYLQYLTALGGKKH